MWSVDFLRDLWYTVENESIGATIFPVFFFLLFSAFFVMFFFVLGKSIRESVKNNHSPRLTVEARVVTKRMQNGYYNGDHRHLAVYYATFEVDSGDRMELSMTGSEYGLLAEGDVGKLSFQGTRYLGFERARKTEISG